MTNIMGKLTDSDFSYDGWVFLQFLIDVSPKHHHNDIHNVEQDEAYNMMQLNLNTYSI